MEHIPLNVVHSLRFNFFGRWYIGNVISRIIFASVLVFACNNIYAQSSQKQALVMLRGIDGIEKLSSKSDITIIKCLSKLYHIYLIECKAGVDIEQTIEALKQRPEVAIAQLNHQVFLRGTVPNDTFLSKQWHLQNSPNLGMDIGAVQIWDSTTGGTTKTGDTIVLGMVELGLETTHPDLQPNIFINHNEIPYNLMDDDSNGYTDDYSGYNTYLNNGSMPPSDHGTAVAGVMGARGNNKIGVSGINWKVKILPVSFPKADEASVVEAYSYYAQMKKYYIQSQGKKGAFVVAVNSSFGIDNGNPKDYPLWCAMYDSLGQLGIVSVAATANSAINTDVLFDMPTGCISNFLVMATNHDFDGSFSNGAAYGKRSIDIAAPGTDIYTTSSNSNYSFHGGTSFAAPQVTGGIGLLYSAACPATIAWVKDNPIAGALFFKSLILNGAKKENNFTNTAQSGGRLYLPSAFDLLKTGFCGLDSFPLAVIYCNQTQICPGEQTQLICLKNNFTKNISWFVQGAATGNADTLNWQNDTPGFYDVKLVVYNSTRSDTLELKNYIRVLNPPQKPIIQINATYLTTKQGTAVYWYDSAGNLLGNGVNYTPTKSGRYYCAYTNPDQCVSVADTAYFYGVWIITQFANGMVDIYPNPATDDLYIDNKSSENLHIEIMDAIGRPAFIKNWILPQGIKQDISVTNLPQGIYFIRVIDSNGNTWVKKVIKY